MVILDNVNNQPYLRGSTFRNWWGDQHRNLQYIHEPFNDEKSVNKWRALGYTQERFTGNMYDMRFDEPEWIKPFRDIFKWDHLGWSVYQMPPGIILPNHQDTYARFRKIHNITDAETIMRAVVFLEDWQSGHYLEINGKSITDWRAGDYIAWSNDTPHLAANMGETDRYTLQMTGVINL